MEKTICIFGDSITWGAFDPKKGGWVSRLKSYFEINEDYNVEVYNQGVSGDDTDSLLARFKTECIARKPQIIIFAIGINDSQYMITKDNPQVSLKKFQNNLIKLINQAKNFSSKIVFIGITKVEESKTMPVFWSSERFYDNNNIFKYNLIIKNLTKKLNLPFMDLFDLLSINDFEDGIHPNSNGHKKIFLKVKDYLLDKKIILLQ